MLPGIHRLLRSSRTLPVDSRGEIESGEKYYDEEVFEHVNRRRDRQ